MDGTEFERGTLNFLLSGIYQKSHRTVGFPSGLGGKESACDEGDWVQSLVQEDLLKKGMATHSSILAWRILWTEGPGGLQSMVLQRVRHD